MSNVQKPSNHKAKARTTGQKTGSKPRVASTQIPPRSGSRLSDEVCRYILELNACNVRPSVVARRVQERFGITITRAHVQKYDPTKANGQKLRPRYREYFYSMRDEFKDAIKNIGIAQQCFRLDQMDELYYEVRHNNPRQALRLLELAAKDVGGFYHRNG